MPSLQQREGGEDLSIIRAPRPASGFTVLDNRLINDNNLGWSAKGLLIYLLSKPDHWEVSVAQLCNHTRDGLSRRSGRDAVYAIVREIEQAGYITKRPKRGPDGNFIGTEYLVSETPSPHTENPDAVPNTDKPEAVEPDAIIPTQEKTEVKEKTELEKENTPRDQLVEEGFEIFYSAGLVKKSKKDALKAWKRTVKGKADPVALARELAADIRQRLEYQQMGFDKLHPSTYLNGQRWEDELVDERLFPAQKNPQGGNPAGNKRDKRVTPRPGESVADESLYGKNYAEGATTDEHLPDYLRH